MRYLVVVCVLVTWPLGLDASPTPRSKLWESALSLSPHEVQKILQCARRLYNMAKQPMHGSDDARLRERALDDARGMLRHATQRVPDKPELFELLAYVEEASGHVERALAAYERYVEIQPGERLSSELCMKHGLLLARLGHIEAAQSRLRACQDITQGQHRSVWSQHKALALVHLANLYLHQGRTAVAIDLLSRSVETGTNEPLVNFALAVAYDKDEQSSRAFEVLDAMQVQRQRDVMLHILDTVNDMEFIQAADRHYFLALLYEVSGFLVEAREQWHTYTRSGDQARYARRAHDHMQAINELLAASNASHGS